ncbi:MAG TPA: tetratricopeptide repeat protein [Verrucomicrobiae bacterium]
MSSTITASEEAQLAQTIEMFEVITQSQPQDYQSLEILKEAYSKLGKEPQVVGTSKRIAQAYVQMGQLSSAILEYETILQRFPDDPDVQSALKDIEAKANNFPVGPPPDTSTLKRNGDTATGLKKSGDRLVIPTDVEDGRKAMYRLFVESKTISAGDFELCWPKYDLAGAGSTIVEPFISVLEDKDILPSERSLKLLSDKSRCAFLPLNLYDLDMDLARTFPAGTCRQWGVLPFDRISKSVLVATVNPFNQQAAKELSAACGQRLLWYLASPVELVKNLRKAFR